MSCSNACQRGGGEEDLIFIPNYSHEVVIAQEFKLSGIKKKSWKSFNDSLHDFLRYDSGTN